MINTLDAVQSELSSDGFLLRYHHDKSDDGLPAGEGVFLASSFWLADALAGMGRVKEATELFERLLDLRNDMGLLSEEYDTVKHRQIGNTPQAFSMVGLINTARLLAGTKTITSARRHEQGLHEH